MNKLSKILLMASLSLAACKKDHTQDLDQFIATHEFILVERWGTNDGAQLFWKVKSGNTIIVLDGVPGDIFWKDPFDKEGTIIPSELIIKIKNK